MTTAPRWFAVIGRAAMLLLMLSAGVVFLPVPGCAQSLELRSQPVAVSLTEVLLISQSPTESKFRLVFSPRANSFEPLATPAGTAPGNSVALGLALTTRGNGAVAPSHLSGLVRSLSFDEQDSVLIVRFATASAAQITTAQVSPQTLEVTIKKGGGAQAASSAGQPPAGPLPAARDPAPGQDGYELVVLRYADVSEVVGLLTDGLTVKANNVFVPREPGFGSNSLTGGNTIQAPLSTTAEDQPLGQSVDSAIAIDRRLNAIWLKGSPERIARMKAQIALIDIPVDSVILETQLVELSESGAKAIGVDYMNSSNQIGVLTLQSGQYDTTSSLPGSNTWMRSAQFQAAVYALVQKGEGRIVSRPRIAAQSGGTAKIITGDAIPILTSITLSGVNGVSQQVQYVNVGVTLQIAPRIAPDGSVSSHVFCVVSSVTSYSSGYPVISQREAETSTTVRDGETFVIGGLSQESTIASNANVPLLGNLPVLGQLFRTTKSTNDKTELYIVVTPHVVHRLATADAGAAPAHHPDDGPAVPNH